MQSPKIDEKSARDSSTLWRLAVEIAKGAPGGAVAAFIMNSVLARRKTRSDSANATRDVRDDLMAEISVYWSRAERDPSVELAVTRLAHKFSAKARNHVERYGKSSDVQVLRALLVEFNKSVSGDNFGSSTQFRTDSMKRAAADQNAQKIMALIK